MRAIGIILGCAISLTGCGMWHAPPAAAPVVAVPADCPPVYDPAQCPPGYETVAPVVEGPVLVPGGSPGDVPEDLLPNPAAESPVSGPLAQWPAGTAVSPEFGLPTGPQVVSGLPNPLAVPVGDDNLAWDQIADVVAGYFRILSEQRASRTGELWTEGRIETAPESGATLLEPHRHDSVGSFNRWESTLQTIRRRAVVRVIPQADSYLVDVAVHKELEDLPHPERASAGAATFRSDGSLPSRSREKVSPTKSSGRWLSLGRDSALEQQMLADIQARLSGVTPRGVPTVIP